MLEHVCMNKTRFSMGFLQNLYLPGIQEEAVRQFLAGSSGHWSVAKRSSNYYLDFGGFSSVDEIIENSLSKKFRKNLSYEARRLEGMCDVRIKRLEGTGWLKA